MPLIFATIAPAVHRLVERVNEVQDLNEAGILGAKERETFVALFRKIAGADPMEA